MVSVGIRTTWPLISDAVMASSTSGEGSPVIGIVLTAEASESRRQSPGPLSLAASCGLQQFTGVGYRRCRDGLAAEHPGDLLHAHFIVVEPPDARARVAGRVFLPDEEVGVAEAGDLGQGRHADDLVACGELLELTANHLSDSSADAGVDLVEHEGGRRGAA